MSEAKEMFPSTLTGKPFSGPHGWVQWKGTEVCMDVHCKCGVHSHIDTDFCYHVKCPACGQVYEVGGHVKLYELDFEPEFTKLPEVGV